MNRCLWAQFDLEKVGQWLGTSWSFVEAVEDCWLQGGEVAQWQDSF